MKKQILTIVLLLVTLLTVTAQQRVVLKMDDGTTQTFESWEIDEMTFTPSPVVTPPATPRIVDLGFAKWAEFNLGATKPSEAGWLVGWGDVTGTNKSVRLKYFPAETYTNDIYETPYDIARAKWGEEWRLPVEQDFQLLKDSCTWELVTGDSIGYKLTSKKKGYEDRSIFLPFTGIRYGKADAVKTATDGFYWTGTIAGDALEARALHIISTGDSVLMDTARYFGLAIRPVYGKFVHDLTVLTGTTADINYQSVLVPLEILGDMSAAVKVGLCFGKATETLSPETATTNNAVQNITEGSSKFNFTITGLDGNTAYKAIGYIVLTDGTYVYSQEISFTTQPKFPVAEEVDLGLSVNWASWNIGENAPEGHAHLYGWGDATGDLTTQFDSEYAVNLPYTTTSIAGNDYFDIAARQWQNGWRMPTMAEFEELYEGTNVTKETLNGVSGYRFTNKSDATKSIFIPYSSVRFGTQVQNYNSAWYWTAEADWNSTEGWHAHMAYLIPNSVSVKRYYKYYGYSIRAVKTNNNYTPGGSGSGTGGTTEGGGDDTGGETGGETGQTTPPLSADAGKTVDLGLPSHTLWADRNIGAYKETDAGGYFAFGDVEAHLDGYGLENYQYYDTATSTYQKIGTDVKGDWQFCGDATYDAATKNWGGKWRMPSDAQINELVYYCNFLWVSNYNGSGMSGYKVTGTNGKFIFLPAAGVTRADGTSFLRERGNYWSGSLNTQKNSFSEGLGLSFTASSHQRAPIARASGCVIRPVQNP